MNNFDFYLDRAIKATLQKFAGSEKVKTQDGRVVILNSDGTWKYEEQNSNQSTPSSRIVYLMSPNKDGEFNRSYETTNFVESESVYKFELTSQNEAQFSIDSRAFGRALNMTDTYVLPVCDETNEFSYDYNSIKTLKKGVATLNGSKWVVKQKAQIQYE
jgi:hypothetical protein